MIHGLPEHPHKNHYAAGVSPLLLLLVSSCLVSCASHRHHVYDISSIDSIKVFRALTAFSCLDVADTISFFLPPSVNVCDFSTGDTVSTRKPLRIVRHLVTKQSAQLADTSRADLKSYGHGSTYSSQSRLQQTIYSFGIFNRFLVLFCFMSVALLVVAFTIYNVSKRWPL